MGSALTVRDPVHGDILITPEEATVLDTWPMQRLRGIKQVGTAYLVYPGCLHTRFEHCLGTLATAARLLTSLQNRGHRIPPDLLRLARLAALVHDVSHLPFGHTFEDETLIFPRHDSPGRLARFLREGETAAALRRLGLQDEVYAVLIGEPQSRGIPPWVAQLVAGAVDADLLDYVRRDAYYAGLAQDYDDRIYAYFEVTDDRLTFRLTRHGMERPDARSELSHLLRLRYFLSERLYYHHAKLAAGAMVARAVELAAQEGLTEHHLYHTTDYGLLHGLDKRLPYRPPPGVRELLDRLLRRKLHKRAYVVSLNGAGEEGQRQLIERFRLSSRSRREAEAELARAARIPAERENAAVIVHCAEASVMKEAAVPVVTPAGIRRFDDPEVGGGEVTCLREMYRRLWRLYVFAPEEFAPAVGREAERLFGFPNEHHRG